MSNKEQINNQTKQKIFCSKEHLVSCELFHGQVDIAKALSAIAGQENADDNEHDIMQEAATYITCLRNRLRELEVQLADYERPSNWIRSFNMNGNLIEERALYKPKLNIGR